MRVYCSLSGAQVVNENERRVLLTIISVGKGNNAQKCFYSQQAIDTAPPIFDGCKLGVDHPDEIEKRIQSEGSVRDLAGWIENCKAEGEALKGEAVVYPGAPYEAIWIQLKAAIKYAQDHPGKEHIGVSINAETAKGTPINIDGETWTKIDQFTKAYRVDIVTEPGARGKIEKVISESNRETWQGNVPDTIAHFIRSGYDKDQASAIAYKMARNKGKATEAEPEKIFKGLSDYVHKLEKTNAPGAADVRRRLDSLGTALKFNGATEAKMKGDPKQLMVEAAKHAAEAYRKASESEADPQKKSDFIQKADDLSELCESEGELQIIHKPGGSDAGGGDGDSGSTEAEKKAAEAKRAAEAEASKKADEAKRANESESEAKRRANESERKYCGLLLDSLLAKSGLGEADQKFLRLSLESERGEQRIKDMVATYTATRVQESQRGAGHFGARVFEGAGGSKPVAVDVLAHLSTQGIALREDL